MRPLLALLLLAGCDGESFETDTGQIVISAEASDLDDGPDGPSFFVAGSTLCPELATTTDSGNDGSHDAMDCFAQRVEGPAQYDGECLTFTGAGTVDWYFTPQECSANEFGYAPVDDHVALTVVDPAEVEGWLPLRLEAYAELLDGNGYRLDAPEGWIPEDGEPLRVVGEQAVRVSPGLRTIDGHVPVAWWDAELDGAGDLHVRDDGSFSAAPGGEGELELQFAGQSYPLGDVVGVPTSAVTRMEIAVLSTDDVEAGLSLPLAARAVAWDRDGHVILGAPVEWHFSHMLVQAGPDAGFPGLDYAMFTDACANPATTVGEQTGVLTASLGLLSATKELTWTPRLQAEPVDAWEADPGCQPPTLAESCGCAGGGGCDTTGSAPAGFTALALAVLLRRRRA